MGGEGQPRKTQHPSTDLVNALWSCPGWRTVNSSFLLTICGRSAGSLGSALEWRFVRHSRTPPVSSPFEISAHPAVVGDGTHQVL